MGDCITVLEYEGGVSAIDSGQVRHQMAACFLLETPTGFAIIETGSNASTGRILEVLRARGAQPTDVSHVIVTHVHLDHAGGAGSLMQELPAALLLAHPYGARHMIDPSRLEAGTRAVYGDEAFDAMYGSLVPVPEERVRIMEDGDRLDIGGRTLEFMDAPGHARHHFTVWDEQTRGWFTGDTFGISYRELDSDSGAFIFPTTTPVQFDPPALLDSMERMMERQPHCMYLTHFGRVTGVERLAEDLRAGVRKFVEIGLACEDSGNRTADIESAMRDWLLESARGHGTALGEADLREVFEDDVRLNTQGIEFWLDHGRG